METSGQFFQDVPVLQFSTDPTYKEWKLLWFGGFILDRRRHGSYLQGMETTVNFRVARINRWHGSYLQGMETSWALNIAHASA